MKSASSEDLDGERGEEREGEQVGDEEQQEAIALLFSADKATAVAPAGSEALIRGGKRAHHLPEDAPSEKEEEDEDDDQAPKRKKKKSVFPPPDEAAEAERL